MAHSTYLADMLLNANYRGGSYTVPTGIWVGLHSADPGPTGTSELSGNGYARVSLGAPASGLFAAPSTVSLTRLIDNAAAALFDAATGDWTAATHWSTWDASTAGHMLDYGALAAPKTVLNTEQANIAIGALDITDKNGL